MTNTLNTVIRDKKGNPRGMAVIVRTENDDIRYGYSLLNTEQDRYSKKQGMKIALARAAAQSYTLPKVDVRCSLVLDAFSRLSTRAVRYFKDMKPDAVSIKFGETLPPYEL